jgi:hypothetical protein
MVAYLNSRSGPAGTWWHTSTLEVARRAPPGRAGCRVALRRNGDIGSGRSAARLVISSIEESRFAYT